MKLIIGLGNPGFRYRNTRHNLGFLVVRELSREFRIPLNKKKYDGVVGKGSFEGEDVILFEPLTYMNLSGRAVNAIIKKSGVKLDDILIICDDINLDFGFVRLRKQGSYGGHNGLESVIGHIGTNEFARLRVGVGQKEKHEDLSRFVLSCFNREERPLLKGILEKAKECALMWVKEGPNKAMTGFNGRQFS